MYKVLRMFDDLLDMKTRTKAGVVYQRYEPGDVYPRKGYNPPVQRILELGTSDNRLRTPLIELTPEQIESLVHRLNPVIVVDEPAKEEKPAKEEPVKEEKPKKKRTTKKKTAKAEK